MIHSSSFIKKLLIFLIIFFGVLFFARASLAATYYIDSVSGSDSYTSTQAQSTSTPWAHCPGDSNATGVPAGLTPAAGDKFIFKGNVQYNGQITISQSGNGTGWSSPDSNFIIYDGDSGIYATRWASGTAKAIIDLGAARTYGFTVSGSRSFIKINNFEIKNGLITGDGSILIAAMEGGSYIEMSNNNLHDAGAHSHTTQNGTCLYTTNVNYARIHDNTLYDCGYTGISVVGSSGTNGSYNEIYNNDITDITAWALPLPCSGTCTNNKIYNNTIHDLVYYLEDPPHVNGIFAFGSGNINNIYVYNNILHNIEGTAQLFINSDIGCNNATSRNGLYIYNNIFANPGTITSWAIRLSTISCTHRNVHIYNNSHYGAKGLISWADAGYGFENFYFKGNSIYASTAGAFGIQGTASANVTGDYIVDYNNYYNTNSNSGWWVDGASYGFSWWQSHGFDLHGKGPTSNPLYNNANPSSYDLTIPANSPLKDALPTAQAPTSIFTTDKFGTSRPQGSAWDIGAYEYVGVAPPPDTTPPSAPSGVVVS